MHSLISSLSPIELQDDDDDDDVPLPVNLPELLENELLNDEPEDPTSVAASLAASASTLLPGLGGGGASFTLA